MKEEESGGTVLRFVKRIINLVGVGLPLLFVGLLIEGIVIFLRRWITLPVPLSIGMRILLTIPCILISVLGIVWFNYSLNLVNIHFQGEEHKLITSGPFNYVRHPLYSALLMGLPPLVLIWFADLLFLVSWLLIFILSHYLVRLEERDLIRTFGDDYKDYKEYVPALIPFKGAGGQRYREHGDDGASGKQSTEEPC
jgi:protein-S-isoprenylcysteine O-methyltransferase Ste14